MRIRHVKIEDAVQLCQLIQQVESDSEYMLFEPGERKITVEQMQTRIRSMKTESHSEIFTAELDGELIGYLMAIGGCTKRTRHAVYLVIGIFTSHRGQGVGTHLFEHLENWAVQHNIRRLELTVAQPNDAGMRLYRKMNFEIEGKKRDSLIINGEYVDEYYMSKLLT